MAWRLKSKSARRLALTAASLLAIITDGAATAAPLLISPQSDSAFVIDAGSIKPFGDHKAVWTYLFFKRPQAVGSSVVSVMAHRTEVDCASERSRNIAETHYAASGQVTDTADIVFPWDSNPPNTAGAEMVAIVCGESSDATSFISAQETDVWKLQKLFLKQPF